MGIFKTLDERREFFKGDKFATDADMYIEDATDEYCICAVNLSEKHQNAYGGVMGGAIFTLADFAFAAFSNNLHHPTVAQQVSINYLSAARGDKLIAKATMIREGRTTMIVNVDVYDNTKRHIAKFIGTGFKL